MDDPENTLITTSKIAGAMNYPSTTQALFALIVMIIVLLFILVYCCWGTFSCARQDESSHSPEDGAAVVREIQGPGGRGSRMVIVPFSNMIYVGDPESRRIYEIPVEQDKPPAYTEVYDGVPPPPYSSDRQGCDTPVTDNSNNESSTRPVRDLPPSYEDCLSTATANNKWPEVLEALMSEQAKKERQQSSPQQSGEMLVTQLPALRMPSMLMVQNDMLSNHHTPSPFVVDVPSHSESDISPRAESEGSSMPTTINQQSPPSSVVTNLLDPWGPPPPFDAPPAWNQNEEHDLVSTSHQQAFTASPTENQISIDENDSISNTTDEDFTPSPATSSTSDSLNLNENQERNITQSHRENNSHSTQDYSRV